EKGLYPYSTYLLRNVRERTGQYWYNHFSTIGIVGMNEALVNFMGKDITTAEGLNFAVEIMHYLREIMVEFQKETGNFYNLEATPAEGTSYRLARIDKQMYPDIYTAGREVPYYTNSTQIPVGFTDDIFEVMELQDELQSLFTGGTVQHLYLGESIQEIEVCRNIIRRCFENYKMPYISITPTFSICNNHGYIRGEHFTCPECGAETEVWSRVTGYLRPVSNYNKGKREEYFNRRKFVIKREVS
ncbi:MAG: ribonucleoside triphosphate reductase, partial [Clostridiaceae bacterium]|nr:ribonucleoside triphosphate reductase [Clostridiaceae bacterium]